VCPFTIDARFSEDCRRAPLPSRCRRQDSPGDFLTGWDSFPSPSVLQVTIAFITWRTRHGGTQHHPKPPTASGTVHQPRLVRPRSEHNHPVQRVVGIWLIVTLANSLGFCCTVTLIHNVALKIVSPGSRHRSTVPDPPPPCFASTA
jgi:hypothetical protein